MGVRSVSIYKCDFCTFEEITPFTPQGWCEVVVLTDPAVPRSSGKLACAQCVARLERLPVHDEARDARTA